MTKEEKKVSIDATSASLGLGFLAATGIVYAYKSNPDKAMGALIIAGFLSVYALPFVLKKSII